MNRDAFGCAKPRPFCCYGLGLGRNRRTFLSAITSWSPYTDFRNPTLVTVLLYPKVGELP
jgi:hypothetical protein